MPPGTKTKSQPIIVRPFNNRKGHQKVQVIMTAEQAHTLGNLSDSSLLEELIRKLREVEPKEVVKE